MEEELRYFPPLIPSYQSPWFKRFIAKLTPIYTNYDITLAEFEALKADELVFSFASERGDSYSKQSLLFVKDRNTLWWGDPDHPNLGPMALTEQVKEIPGPENLVAPRIYQRLKSIVNRLRQHPKMTEAKASELGILTRPKPEIDPTDYTPVLKAKVQQGQIILDCPLKGFPAYEIWRDDQGGINFTNSNFSLTRYWADNIPLPPGVKSQLRSFRTRMLGIDGQPVGNYSNVVQASAVSLIEGE